MNSNMVIVIVVQFIFACAPLNRQASALDRDKDPEQLWNIGWELSQECLTHRDTIRVKGNRQTLLRREGRIRSMPPQSDLLQELLTPMEISYVSIQTTEEKKIVQPLSSRSKEQETDLLEKIVETSTP